MSDKRKGFRHLFTLGFFATVLILIGGFMAWCAYYFIVLFIGVSSVGTSLEDPADSLALKQPIDSTKEIAKKIIIEGDEYHPNEIHDSLFSFRINYDSTKNGIGEWNNHIKSVTIFRLPGREKIQTVVPPEIFSFESYQIPVIVEDMNFDGYNDFRTMSWFMTRGQTFYNFWLYDPAKGKFKADTFMSNNMWDVQFDHQAKTVTSNQRLAGGPFNHVNEVYAWENGKLILQHKEECDQNPFGDDVYITMTKRINGKLVERTKHFDSIPLTKDWQVVYDWDKLK
jgi:hypothetical protein